MPTTGVKQQKTEEQPDRRLRKDKQFRPPTRRTYTCKKVGDIDVLVIYLRATTIWVDGQPRHLPPTTAHVPLHSQLSNLPVGWWGLWQGNGYEFVGMSDELEDIVTMIEEQNVLVPMIIFAVVNS